MNKTILIYVLSAQPHPWGGMIQTAKETWDAEPLEGTETLYYTGAPMRENAERVVYFPVEEDYATMGRKDLLAYQWALANRQWDYMARAHSSCYVHKRRLLEEVQTLPERGVFRGLVVPPTFVSGTERPFVWGGGHFIMSRDVIQAFVDHGHRWRHDWMEDVAMSELAQDCGFTLDGGGRSCTINKQDNGWNCINYGGEPGFDFTDFADIAKNDNYFFRCKHDPARSVDATVMRLLKQHLPV